MPAHSMGAADAESKPSGIGTAKCESERTEWAKPPNPARQVGLDCAQRFSFWSRHHSHAAQLPRCQPTPTLLAGPKITDLAPHSRDDSNDFMPWDEWVGRDPQIVINEVKIRMAYAAVSDAHINLSGT